VGDHVLVTKGIALEGTAILAQDFADVALKSGLTRQDLEEARKLMTEVSVVQEALILAEHGATSMHDVTRGGVLETLMEIALLSNVRISIDASRVPIPPIVSQFASAFQFDPLRMISSGTLAATVPPDRMSDVSDSLRKAGVPFADVGRVTEGVGVLLLHKDGNIHYREIHCEEDELARMWTLYPRDE
jgi:hydrogenase expression/formation protein HypE